MGLSLRDRPGILAFLMSFLVALALQCSLPILAPNLPLPPIIRKRGVLSTNYKNGTAASKAALPLALLLPYENYG